MIQVHDLPQKAVQGHYAIEGGSHYVIHNFPAQGGLLYDTTYMICTCTYGLVRIPALQCMHSTLASASPLSTTTSRFVLY